MRKDARITVSTSGALGRGFIVTLISENGDRVPLAVATAARVRDLVRELCPAILDVSGAADDDAEGLRAYLLGESESAWGARVLH